MAEEKKEKKAQPKKKSPAKRKSKEKKTDKKKAVKSPRKKVNAKKGKGVAKKEKVAVKKEKVKKEKVLQAEKAKKEIWTRAKRKTACLRAKLTLGEKGGILINKKAVKDYFPFFELQAIIDQPFKVIGAKQEDFSFVVDVKGGGNKGQAEATRRAISLALSYLNPDWRLALKKAGFLTSDARIKERKKPGLKRARRAPQWRKR